ncbi:MAG: hypothetical protein LBH74_02930, partial [Nitrososphaerota archaeon]|nr:hypothetical protein [Nitrososphaerota archaeon]
MPSTSAQTIVYVGNETALRNAVDTAVGHTIIALTADIQLTTTPLNIVAGKNIALTSNSPGVFFRLIGASGETTIRNNGTLEIAGITVTHSSGANGIGVTNYGLLILSNGTISGNTALIGGGGVDTWGDFIMNGGSITNNTAEDGGGIAIASIIDSSGMIIRAGTFTMNGGTISDNTATSWGGGVYMSSPYYFTMNGGEISNNIADNNGGGVYHIRGTFTMGNGSRIINNQAQNYGGGVYSANLDTNDVIINGGEISNNTATSGGGMSILSNLTMNGGSITNNTAVNGGGINLSVAVSGDPNVMSGNFTMNGGVISNNTATFGGGVRMVSQGNFTMNSGEISNNTAEDGGGVCQIISTLVGSVGPFILNGGTISNNIAHFGGGIHNDGSVIMYNGTITNNTATDGGGGVHTRGDFNMYGGEISNNTATLYGGGGVYNYYGIFNLFGGAITHNTATDGGGINNEFGNVTMAGGAIYSNTATYGGGIYNTYRGNFTMLAGTISNNAAIDGGGIYFDSTLATGQVKLYNGTISGNTASVDGGGVWVAYENLNRLFVYDGMVFFNNRASAAYDRNPIDDALYYAQIGSNVVWTTPFTQGYNNYDISYTNGARLILYNVTVNDSYASVTGAGSYQAGDPVTINAGTRPGYTFTGWTINEGSITLPNTPTATFTMPPTDVVVTANWQADQTLTGTISVTKLTNPPSASIPFSFITSAPPGTFSLTDGTTWQSGPLTPGNYTLTEIAQAGWDLSNIIINDPTNNSRVDLASRTVFIALDPGETITILYQNTQHSPQMGSINVVKTTCPTDASNVFNFVTSISPGTFSLTDGATWQSGPLTPGNYTLTEIAQSGWDLANIIIIDPTNNSRVDLASR